MSIFKRNGNWFVRYRDSEGKQREKKAGATKALAQELERKILSERDLKKRFGYEEIEQISMSDLIKKYREYSITHKKPSTVDVESFYLNNIADFFNKKYVSEITVKDIDCFKSERAVKLKNSSVNREICVLKNMLAKAVEWGYLESIPKIKNLKNPPGRLRYLSIEEYKRLKAAAGEYTRQAIDFDILTALRKGELLKLEIDKDIDVKNRILHIKDSKTGERRDMPISDELLMLIDEIRGSREEGLLFNKGDFRKGFEGAVKRAGIKDFHFHDLRHTAASWMAIAGESLFVIKEILGHKDIKMTMRYAHLSPDVKISAMQRQGERLKKINEC